MVEVVEAKSILMIMMRMMKICTTVRMRAMKTSRKMKINITIVKIRNLRMKMTNRCQKILSSTAISFYKISYSLRKSLKRMRLI
jgi:hypothetical protein